MRLTRTTVLRRLRARNWVVYAKPPFGGPEKVLAYLGRYTHRTAISNARLVSMTDGKVTFRYKRRSADGGWRTMTLDAVEFLRRFAGHVLPKGFVRMRYWGLLANRKRRERLARCRSQLGVSAPSPVNGATHRFGASLAIWLTRHSSTEELLSYVAQDFTFSERVTGFQQAAEGFFGQPLTRLQPHQAALLAALSWAPRTLLADASLAVALSPGPAETGSSRRWFGRTPSHRSRAEPQKRSHWAFPCRRSRVSGSGLAA